MRMGQGVRTGLGQGASPVSYRHNFLIHTENGILCALIRIASLIKENRKDISVLPPDLEL